MATKRCDARIRNELRIEGGDSFALAIVEDSDLYWRFRVLAHLGDGTYEVGLIHTQPRGLSGAAQCRVIAAGCCPGAKAWEVQAQPWDARMLPPGVAESIVIELTTAAAMQTPSFIDLERRSVGYRSGVDGVVQLLPGQRVVSWIARAVAPGATVQLNNGALVDVPPAAVLRSDVEVWGARLSFVGTSNYVVQLEG